MNQVIGEGPKKAGEISVQLSNLANNLASIRDTINVLEERFRAVVRPVGPSVEETKKSPVEATCDMEEILRHCNEVVTGNNNWLLSIIERCEL